MVQGTGSSVGKSLLVAGMCRAYARRGFRVRPFKPQNMSNNSSPASDGGEIGRAQALQAMACGIEPTTDMNPVLLKPETETGAQVVIKGKRVASMSAREFAGMKGRLAGPVLGSFASLAKHADIVIAEGAGSPAEANLRAGDIANMGFARAAGIPVVLVGDIDRGGVIAQLVGTQAVMGKPDADMVRGFSVNKFRGDKSLFEDGYRLIEQRTGWPGLGIVPWFEDARLLPSEDAMELRSRGTGGGSLKIVCLALSRIANFDDLDPLRAEPGVSVELAHPGSAIPSDADLVVIPGTKSTRGDLEFIFKQGWHHDILAHARRGGHVLGICGGYQMLGRAVSDASGHDGTAGTTEGFGLLDVETEMGAEKRVTPVKGMADFGGGIFDAYEIHLGATEGPDRSRPFARIRQDGGWAAEGAVSADGRVFGTYLHGLFASGGFRKAFLERIGGRGTLFDYKDEVLRALDSLADHLEAHMDLDRVRSLMAVPNIGQQAGDRADADLQIA